MDEVSDRHSGDLGGALRPFDPTEAIVVRVTVDHQTATRTAAQHTAWMLLNLLVRAQGVVSRIELDCPSGIEVAPFVVPFGSSSDLRERLFEAIREIDVVPMAPSVGAPANREVFVAPASDIRAPGSIAATGFGWWGGVAVDADPPHEWRQSDLNNAMPIGPYVAAALAAGDVFLRVRDPRYTVEGRTYGWDVWTGQSESTAPGEGPLVDIDLTDVALAGVGAVGSAWIHTLWATPGLRGTVAIADSDEEGVTTTNLNRGLLFRKADVSHSKASVAKQVAVGAIAWQAIDGRFETGGVRPAVLVSAVDTNEARDALQSQYPARTLSGSTRDLRAETMMGGKPGTGACLRCNNPLETAASDRELRERLATAGSASVETVAHELGVTAQEIKDRLEAPRCDVVSDRMLTQLRRQFGTDAPSRFAVGFTSAMAGVLLAAETLRLYLETPLDAESRRTSFQFRRPDSEVNGVRPYPRDARCPKCDPGSRATGIWLYRYDGWMSAESARVS